MAVKNINNVTIIIDARREEYSKEKAKENTMTIKELIQVLEWYAEDYGEDAKIVLSHDNGYTYGGIRERLIREEIDPIDEEE